MSDFFRNFVKSGLIDAIGKLADHTVKLTAAEWHGKGVLLEEDLAEIQARIDAKNGVSENTSEAAENEA